MTFVFIVLYKCSYLLTYLSSRGYIFAFEIAHHYRRSKIGEARVVLFRGLARSAAARLTLADGWAPGPSLSWLHWSGGPTAGQGTERQSRASAGADVDQRAVRCRTKTTRVGNSAVHGLDSAQQYCFSAHHVHRIFKSEQKITDQKQANVGSKNSRHTHRNMKNSPKISFNSFKVKN